MMTPERRAEIDAMLIRNHDDEELADALHDAIVEIDRLNKAVDQAIDAGELGLGNMSNGDGHIARLRESDPQFYAPSNMYPELAAELERRRKA